MDVMDVYMKSVTLYHCQHLSQFKVAEEKTDFCV